MILIETVSYNRPKKVVKIFFS